MAFYSELFSVGPLKLLLFSIVSYFIYVHLLKPALHYIYIVIHYHGFHYQPKSFLLGHLRQIWPNFPFSIDRKSLAASIIKQLCKTVGPDPSRSLSVLWISLFPLVCASGHEIVEEILHKKNLRKPRINNFVGLGDGLLISEPALWKVRRKLIEPFFTTRKMRDHVKNMYQEVKSFGKQLDEEVDKPVDLINHIQTSTLNVILKSSAGIPLDDLKEDKEKLVELIAIGERYGVQRMGNPFWHFDWIFNMSTFSKAYYKTIENMKEMAHTIFRKRKQLLQSLPSNQPENQDFLFLIEGKVDDQGLLDEMNTLIAAGHETIELALRWTLFNLGNHLDVQEKLYKEIVQFFPDDTPIDDMDKLKECVYLDQCVKETLRLNPPVWGFARQLEDDIMVKGQRLIKGSIVGIVVEATHHDPKVYPNTKKYDPDRWNPENASKIPKTAFIPFGYGPRMCIGYRYAIIELKIFTIQIIRKFSLRSIRPHGSIPQKAEITLKPVEPLEIIMKPRTTTKLVN
ncbi:probable cytochrome P450 4ac1 [Tetranychus urticae]|uniref:Cytochrome P450 n=1 Tax=Tetranychus urticae TaxID=32264 RepID=T1K5K7_TETUR|nr:probable cytochrome P450 4ac1 [Tetranychus urticae]